MMQDDDITRLFRDAVPEIAAGLVEIKAVARQAGTRTKIAVSSTDPKIDCVGVCVGVRGHRIKNVVDELGGERIDIVRWNDSLQVMISNALQPAQIEEVYLYARLRRAFVLVKEDQLSLAHGRDGLNARLASKLVAWHLEIMTQRQMDERIEHASRLLRQIPEVTAAVAELLLAEGLLSYRDLASLTPDKVALLAGVTHQEAEAILRFAAERANEDSQ